VNRLPRVSGNAAPVPLPAKLARFVFSPRVHDKTLEAPHEAAASYSRRANKGVNLTLRSAERHRPVGLRRPAGRRHVCSRRLHPTR
jgi:hypothetical protein